MAMRFKIPINNNSTIVEPDENAFSVISPFGIFIRRKNSFLVDLNEYIWDKIKDLEDNIYNFDKIKYKREKLLEKYKLLKEKTSQIVNTKFKYLYDFQKEVVSDAVSKLVIFNQVNLFEEVGAGKTIQALVISKFFKGIKLVVCPASLTEQWRDEILKFKIAKPDKIVVVSGKQKTERFFEYFRVKSEYEKNKESYYIIISYETLKNDLNVFYDENLTDVEEALVNYIKLIILDEAHKVKNRTSQNFKATKRIVADIPYVVTLTGTPFKNSVFDIFNIATLRSRTIFGGKLVVLQNWVGKDTRSVEKAKELLEMIKEQCYVIKKKDVLKHLPPINEYFYKYTFTSCEETKEIANLLLSHSDYDVFQLFSILRILDCGSLYLSSITPKKLEIIKDIKERYSLKEDFVYDSIKTIIENIQDEQILFFSSYKIILDKLCRKLENNKVLYPEEYKILTGDLNTKEKNEILDNFKKGRLKYLFATDTINYGVNFPDVDHLVHITLPLTYSEYVQRNGRIHRATSKNPKFIYSFYGNIVGERIVKIIQEKRELHNTLDLIKKIVGDMKKENI